jgi:hypothetical protein
VRAACAGPSATGPWSATASDSINIVEVPIPAGAGNCTEGGVVQNNSTTRVFVFTEACNGTGFFPRWQVQQLSGPNGWTGNLVEGPADEFGKGSSTAAQDLFLPGNSSARWNLTYGQRQVRLCATTARCGAWSPWINNNWIGG